MRTPDAKKQQLERLIRNWERYRRVVIDALGESKVSARDEERFLKLKATLAEEIQVLSNGIPRALAHEAKQQLDAMADLVKRHVTLTRKDMGARWEHEDFENTWHQYYIFLSRMRGMEMATGAPLPKEFEEAPAGAGGSRLWTGLGWTLAAAALGLLIFVVASAAGVSVGGVDGVSFSAPPTLSHAMQNASEAFGSLTAGLHLLVEPVVAAYGAIWSLAIVAALVILLGFYMMMRT